MSRSVAYGLLVACGLSLAGCTNKITSNLEVDGKRFEPTSCRSLQPFGRRGVELENADGAKVRLVLDVDGGGSVLYFKGGSSKGKKLGACADLTVQNQNSTINKVTNVMGKAKVDCTEGDPEISGSVTFENCH